MILALALGIPAASAFGPDPVTTIVGDRPHVTPYGSGVAMADVNGDGFDDVLLAYIGGVEAYLGGPGGIDAVASWVHPMPTVLLGEGAQLSRLGDVNGDGYDDVAIAFASAYQVDSYVEVWHGSPAGLGGSPDQVLFGPAGEGGFGEHLAGADVDLDGYDDLVVVTPITNGGRVELFRGSSAGIGATPRILARGSASDPVVGPVSVGDHDGNGHADLVVGASGSRAATLLLGDGTGRFQRRPVAPPQPDVYQVALADFDGDGRDEIVLAGVGLIWVHAGGSQAVGPAVPWLAPAGYFEPTDVAGPYDVDGDGLDDLVFAGVFATVTAFGRPSGNPFLEAYDTWYADTVPELGPLPFQEVDVGDVDGDGQTDYLSESYWSIGARLTYAGTDLAGARFWNGAFGSLLAQPFVVGDYDGDGVDDVGAGTQVFLGSPGGLTTSTVPYQAPATVEGLQLDVDGNGILDTVVWEDGLAWYRDRPAGQAPDQFLPARAGSSRAELVVGDVNGDGHDDVYALVTDSPDRVLLWFAGSAAGLGSPVSVADAASGDDLVSCEDSNGDGRCDLLARQWPAYLAFPGTAAGPGGAVPVPALSSVRDQRDYNGDGLVDLLGQTTSGAAAVVYGGPTGWDGSDFTVLSEPRLSPLPLGDVDDDGFEDVAVVGLGPLNAGEVRIHYGSGSGLDPVPASILVGSEAEGLGGGVVAVDVDGDGVKELVVGASAYGDGAGALHVYEP